MAAEPCLPAWPLEERRADGRRPLAAGADPVAEPAHDDAAAVSAASAPAPTPAPAAAPALAPAPVAAAPAPTPRPRLPRLCRPEHNPSLS